MRRSSGTWPRAGLVAIVVVVAAAAALVPGAVAGIASGALNCTLPKYNPTHYAIQTGQHGDLHDRRRD